MQHEGREGFIRGLKSQEKVQNSRLKEKEEALTVTRGKTQVSYQD